MNRMFQIAWREFASTALTKGFIIGGFVVPAVILAVMVTLLPILLKDEGPAITGEVSIIDNSGVLTEDIAHRLSKDVLEAESQPIAVPEVDPENPPEAEEAAAMLSSAMPSAVPELSVNALDVSTDVEEAKKLLLNGSADDGGLLALAVIDENAVATTVVDDNDIPQFGAFKLFVKPRLKDKVHSTIRRSISDSIREARLEQAGLSPDMINSLTKVNAERSKEITEEGERDSVEGLNFILPGGFMILMMMAVMIGGQYLLTTTVEEKSSRVVEVLLSAVSPMQLMTGKILGQLMVGLLIMTVYGGVGITGLVFAAMSDLINPLIIIWMLAFFFLAYIQIASMMAAIGSAVNEMREAQSLMTPVMAVIMIPYLLWMPVAMNPSGTFAVVCSFLPPVNSFMMIVRIASTEPPEIWEILLSLAISVVSSYIILRGAAKIFRVGLLMYGKPPNLKTLIKWVRMA
jgi:ABC-2 type transport system permease protein